MRAFLAALLVAAVACSNASVREPSPAPGRSPAAGPSPVSLRPPAQAILDAAPGLPLLEARDHLTAAEAASRDADQPLALQTYVSWGWAEESTRSWGAGGSGADALVLATLRPEGARLAFAHYAQETDLAPYAGAPCPAAVSGLSGCHLGVSNGRTVVTGWLAEEVFVIGGTGVDVPGLAAAQAVRLRA